MPSGPHHSELPPEVERTSRQLVRGMGLAQATSVNMLNMIGIGPFITIGTIISAMGGPQAILGWLLGALVAVCDGLVYAELGAAMPGAGGAYIYFREAFNRETWGRIFSFLFLWETIFVAPLSIAAACVGFGDYLGFASGFSHRGVTVSAMAACVLVAVFLRQTRWGAYIYSIGDNPSAARVTGIPTRPIIVLQYVLAALIGCFAGLVLAASVNSMPTRIFNSTLIYDVILVVVLGGIGLSGGRGGVLNVIIGTLLIGTMLNGMTIMDIPYAGQNLIKGVVLLLAVITDSFLNPRNEETAQQGDI